MYCSNCGIKVEDSYKYCINCGTKMPIGESLELKLSDSKNKAELTNYFRKQSEKYLPGKIKFLLIGESPPIKKENFFYTDTHEKGNQMFFYNIIMAIYDIRYKKDTTIKRELLNRFKEDSFYLIDVVGYPINNVTNSKRGDAIREEIPYLINKIKDYNLKGNVDEFTKIILIKNLVAETVLEPLENSDDIIFDRTFGIRTLGFPKFFNDPDFVDGLKNIVY